MVPAIKDGIVIWRDDEARNVGVVGSAIVGVGGRDGQVREFGELANMLIKSVTEQVLPALAPLL
jgi:hypothetical protein